MTGEERKRYDDDVEFRNAACEHGSQRRKCNTCELLCEQHDNAALRDRIEVLEQAIEWAIQYLERDVFNVDEVNALIEWMIDELRRRAKEG
jgi:hypothetical protein